MSGDRSRWTVQYMQRVLATDPIAYWMQDEKQGLVSYDMVTARSDGARNGLYTGGTLGQPGIGDGRTSRLSDGALDYDDIYSASLNAAFNGAEGTMLCWAQVANAGVWTDGAIRQIMILDSVVAGSQIFIRKQAGNNVLRFAYTAGGISEIVDPAENTTTFFSAGITWSASAGGTGEMRAYIDGVQQGATQVGLGVWAGALNIAQCLIGALSQVPAQVWDGPLAHNAAWDRPLSPAEMLSLGVL